MPCDNSKASSEIEHVEWSTGTGSGHHYTNVRFGSSSSQASQSSGDICRICHCESDPVNPLLTPCYCSGSLKYVHQTCLQQWLTASETNSCELCKFPFIMHTKIKPFNEWRSLDISGIERRRLCCSVLFHCAAALCVIWSLCVLIERAAEDVQRGLIDWPFWTKLAVVTVGLTGGIVFMYIQCKAYLHLCHRWKARNRILLIQNAPEKIHPVSPPSPAVKNRTNRLSTSNTEAHNSQIGNVVGMACAEITGNITQTSNGYDNYAPQISNMGTNTHASAATATSPRFLASSPHHMLDDADLDLNSHGSHSITSDVQHIPSHHQHHHHHHHSHHHNHAGQVAVAANIECTQSQQNYERDWALDDVVSQISSFRPCPQGSGSMTPFHDSIHNVLEHSEDSSRISTNDLCVGSRQDLSADCISSDTGREHALQLSSFSAGSGDHKAPSISSGVSHAVANGLGGFVYKPHTKRYSNSSIFLENRDILNDSVTMGLESTSSSYDYPKADYHRHSGILTPPDNGETFFGRDLRRHSDTKLLGSVEADVHDPMLYNTPPDDYPNDADILPGHSIKTINTDPDTATCKRIRHLLKQHSANEVDTVIDMELPTSPLFPPPAEFTNPSSTISGTIFSDSRKHHNLHNLNDNQNLNEEQNEAHLELEHIHSQHHYQYYNKQALRHSLDLIDSSGGIYSNDFNNKRNCETPEYVNGFIAKQYRQEQELLQQQQQFEKLQQLQQNHQQHQHQHQHLDEEKHLEQCDYYNKNQGYDDSLVYHPQQLGHYFHQIPNPKPNTCIPTNSNSSSHQQQSDLSKVFFKSLPNLSSNSKTLLNK